MTGPFNTSSFPAEDPAPAPKKKGSGCMKWGSIVTASFFIFMGLTTACGPERVETEVPGPTLTETVTSTAPGETITSFETETETVTSEVEAAAEEPSAESNPGALEERDTRQNSASIPDPAPAPVPAVAPALAPPPASVGRTITGGAFCKGTEVGQTGQTSTGLTMTCSTAPSDNRARWR